MPATEALLQEMLDEFQLRKLVNGYCRAVDRGDMAKLREFYHHDAKDAHGAFSTGSVDDFLGELAAARPYIRSMQHNITTVNFAISGDSAEGEIYTIAIHTFSAGDRDVDVVVGGRYLDKYEKRDDTWKLIERTIVTDWARVNDPSSVDLSHPITRDTLKALTPMIHRYGSFRSCPRECSDPRGRETARKNGEGTADTREVLMASTPKPWSSGSDAVTR